MTINLKILTFLFVSGFLCFGCKKTESEIITAGTYSGEKIIFYRDPYFESHDTIIIEFKNNEYTYTGSIALDFGSGSYLTTDNLIQFNDVEVRNALYSWDWILGGKYVFRISNDSVIMNQNGQFKQVTCRLMKVTN